MASRSRWGLRVPAASHFLPERTRVTVLFSMGLLWVALALWAGYVIGRRSGVLAALEASWRNEDARFLDELRKKRHGPSVLPD